MNILYSNTELDKRALYKHTRGQGIALKDVDHGKVIEPKEVVIFEQENNRGEIVKVVSIIDKDGSHYISSSPYFINELQDIAELMGADSYAVMIIKKQSKAGRVFTTCELV